MNLANGDSQGYGQHVLDHMPPQNEKESALLDQMMARHRLPFQSNPGQ